MRAGARLAALLLLVLPLGVDGSALASRPTPCRVIPDVPGDAAYSLVTPSSQTPLVPGTSDDDLLSADVASDGRHLTAVWRLARVTTPDPVAPMGREYVLVFDVQGKGTWFVAARTYPTGTQYLYGDFGVEARIHAYPRVRGQARGRLDPARGLVVVDAPASAIAGGLRRGTTLRALRVTISRMVGQGLVPSREVAGLDVALAGTSFAFDSASGRRSYVVGTRSCVHPGL